MSKEEADAHKKTGNDLFVEKKYDEAIEAYSKAITCDPTIAVLYSNRSACWSAKSEWQKAYDDATECIKNDMQFVKGYYRLSVAQVEMGSYDDALATLSTALKIEPDSEMIRKALNNVHKRKANIRRNKQVQLDDSQKKEYMELQESTQRMQMELRRCNGRLNAIERETKITQATSKHVEETPDGTKLFKAIGKAFFLQSKPDTLSKFKNVVVALEKQNKEMLDRKKFLEKFITDKTKDMQAIIGTA